MDERGGRETWPGRVGAFWRAEAVIFLGAWLALMVGGRSQMIRDPGTFWHTVAGRRMLASGRPLDTDPFSFTFGGRPWVAYEWLAECIMGAVHTVGGLNSLLLATATLLAALAAWMAHRLIRAGLHPLPTTLVVALAMGAGAVHFHPRPHLATIALLGITFGLLGDVEAGRAGLGRLGGLVPLFVLWSNCHGGMLGGLATLVLAVGGWVLYGLLGRDSPIARPRQAIAAGLLIVACGLSALVNPYGWGLPRTWLQIMASPAIARLIQEHQPPDPSGPEFRLLGLLGLAYLAALVSTLPRWPRVTWLIPLAWLALALARVRHAPLFGITAALALADMLPATRLAAWLARPGRDWFRAAGPAHEGGAWRAMALPVAVVVAAVVCQVAGLRVPVLGRGWARPDPRTCPVGLLPALRGYERQAAGDGRIFNDLLYGGFLIYYVPGLKVFIDDRCELYGDARLTEFAEAASRAPGRVEAWSRRYRFRLALVQDGSGFDRYLDRADEWRLVRRADGAALYRRAEGGEVAGTQTPR
jgi:hypothetical protein